MERRKHLTTQKAAAYLNISVRTLHNWLRDGIVKGHRCGPRLLRFDCDELDAATSRL
jgi:excisionase family DNA binding protein